MLRSAKQRHKTGTRQAKDSHERHEIGRTLKGDCYCYTTVVRVAQDWNKTETRQAQDRHKTG